CFFFFQAEDGIRDFHVTGVQTCALPILGVLDLARGRTARGVERGEPAAVLAVGESASERRDAVIDELGGAGPPEECRERVDVGHPARDPQLDRTGRLERAVVAEPAEAERGAARLAEAEESFGMLGEGAAMRRTIYRSHAKKLSCGQGRRRRPLAPETRARHT